MVQKWTMYIEVSCQPKPGQVVIYYLLHNQSMNHVLQNRREVSRRTTNNEAYYIALVEGLKAAKEHGAKNIAVATNSMLICNQMNGEYKFRKDHLKLLHREAKNVVNQFQTFTINYQAEVKRMCTYIVSRVGAVATFDVQYVFSLKTLPKGVILENEYIFPWCGCFLLILVVISIMAWLYHNSY